MNIPFAYISNYQVLIQKYCQNTVENADSEIASGYARVMHGIFQPMADLTFVNSHNLTIG